MVGWCDYWAVLGARQQGGYFGSAANLSLGLGNAARSVITFDVWRVPTPADCVHGYTVTWPLVLSCSHYCDGGDHNRHQSTFLSLRRDAEKGS